jgi:transcriptional regulator with XRE-family HTH domain
LSKNYGVALRENQRKRLYLLIGHNVKRLRAAKGVSQLALSLEMGLKSVSLVSKAEIYLDRKHFNLEHLATIANVLHIDIREFFDGYSDAVLSDGASDADRANRIQSKSAPETIAANAVS